MKNNIHRFPKTEATPRVYQPAKGERLWDGEPTKVDYEVRVRLEGLTKELDDDFPRGTPAWFPAILMFLIGLAAGVFLTASVVGL